MVDQYFKFVHTEKAETNLESILQLAESMVKRFGIKGFCLSPWNWVDHLRMEYMSETEYVSQCLTKIVRFAKKFNVAFFLIAHTTKMQKDKQTGKYEVPTLYSISGSAHFFNKTHNGITIYRDYTKNSVDVYVQKVKQSWQGELGFCSFNYNTFTRQYEPYT
jgi:twinkle protein